MKLFARLALVAVLSACAAVPALADDKSDLQAKVSAALKHAKSFTATTLLVGLGVSTTTMYVAPDRTKTSVALAGSTRDIVTVGGTAYVSVNGAPYEKRTLSPAQAATLTAVTDVSVSAIVPDVSAGGTTYGAFETVAGAAPTAVTLTCTYDKKTYLLVKCSSDSLVQMFGNYDDPKNVIDVPKEAA